MGRRPRRDRSILLPAIGGQLVASTGLFVLPFTVVALLASGNGFDERSAGVLVSLESIAAALTTVVLAAWTQRHCRRRVALTGAGLAIVANVVAWLVLGNETGSNTNGVLIGARLLAGVGAGIVMAEVAAIVARGLDRERLIASLSIASIINGSLWIYLIPNAPEWAMPGAPYLAMLLASVVGLLLLFRLPAPVMRFRLPVPHAPVDALPRPEVIPKPRPEIIRRGKLSPDPTDGRFSGAVRAVVLPGVLLTQLAQGAFWTFVAVYGANAGVGDEDIGSLLSVMTLLLLVGVVGTAALGGRFGRFPPLFLLTVINVVSIVAITYAHDPLVYTIANVIQAITNLSSLVYQLGLAAALDRSGRLFTAANGLVGLGNGLGAAVAGAIAFQFGAAHIGLAVVLFNGIALACYSMISLGVSRQWIVLRA